MSARHTPGMQCVECEGFCLVKTIDDANTALAVARTPLHRLMACEALAAAANLEAELLRAAIAKATWTAA